MPNSSVSTTQCRHVTSGVIACRRGGALVLDCTDAGKALFLGAFVIREVKYTVVKSITTIHHFVIIFNLL